MKASTWQAAIAAAGALLAAGLWARPALGDERPNPHGASGACAECHAAADEGALPEAIDFRDGGADASCRRCHTEDPHKVGLTPDRAEVPEELLLVGGKLACLSCHDEPACDGDTLAEDNAHFFRGGPYQKIGELCARCHPATSGERFNPHEAMAAGGHGEVCAYCHVEAPTRDATDVDLMVSAPNICLGCHVDTVHAGSTGHVGPAPEAVQALAKGAGLPLSSDGRIVCGTCHDPHPVGATASADARAGVLGQPVLSDSWQRLVLAPALSDRSEQVGVPLVPKTVEPDLLRLPLASGELCRACHRPSAIEESRESQR